MSATPSHSRHRQRRHSSPEETITKFRLTALNDKDSDSGSEDEDESSDIEFDSPYYKPRGRPLAPKIPRGFFQPLTSPVSAADPKENSKQPSEISEILSRNSVSLQHLTTFGTSSFQKADYDKLSGGHYYLKNDQESADAQPLEPNSESKKTSSTDQEQSNENAVATVAENSEQYTELAEAFSTIFRDKLKYKSFLELRGDQAQSVLNSLQTVLDRKTDSIFTRGDFLHALLRLSNKSGLYPECFTLRDVRQTGLAVAAGHFGEVWKGDFHGSSVCLKIVKAYQNSHIEKLLKAYAKEAILWSHLSHPNLLPFYGIYHLGDEHGRICLVSPWIENGNIVEYLQQFPDTKRPRLLGDIAQGISYLHDNNIIHGDLKGANILVTSNGRACLSDFGLSSVTDSDILRWTSLQSTVAMGGTVRWQAPELVDPDAEIIQTTKESDVYAFACVCYELFTGKVPFYEIMRDAAVTLRISRGEQPSEPDLTSRNSDSVFNRGLTKDMWILMKKCWCRDPSERPNMVGVLSKILTDESDTRPEQNWEEVSSARFRRTVQNSFSQVSASNLAHVIELLSEI